MTEERVAGASWEDRNPSFRKTDIAGRMARDPVLLAKTIATVVSAGIAKGTAVTVSDVTTPVGAGSSNETFLFTAAWNGVPRGLVLRIAPSEFQLFMDPRMKDQFRLLRALHQGGRVAVAEPLLFVDSDAPFGKPFMVMERLRGRVPVSFPPYNSGGFVFDATPAQRRMLWEEAVDQLAAINTTPLDEVAFLAEAEGDGDFDAQFGWWAHGARWAGVDHYPAIAEMERWLLDNCPHDPPAGLSWGDARIGNIMFADDYRVAGVMDWEQAGLGGALVDLGWWLYFDRFHSDTLGLTRLEGLGDRAETVARWERTTGIAVTDMLWYESFAGYKVAIITARKMALEGTSLPNNNGNNNIATQQNARIRGIAPPEDVIETR